MAPIRRSGTAKRPKLALIGRPYVPPAAPQKKGHKTYGAKSTEVDMTRQTLAGACKVAILFGLLSTSAAYAQGGNPPGSDLSPAKSNCSSPTGCANYATGNVTSQNPAAAASGSYSPTGPGGDLSPAKSNCDSPTGCASYATGNETKDNPAQPSSGSGQQQK
jgi:hypothetical protein